MRLESYAQDHSEVLECPGICTCVESCGYPLRALSSEGCGENLFLLLFGRKPEHRGTSPVVGEINANAWNPDY